MVKNQILNRMMTLSKLPILKFLLLLLIISTNVSAKETFLEDQQEERARKLFLQIKCLVCEGQVIESSNTQIALDMRNLVRKKISQNLTDEQIKQYFLDNYGEEIWTQPPVNKNTLILWFMPLLIFVIALIIIANFFFKNNAKKS